MQGKLQPDRFTGGLRLNVTQVWDLPAARARFGRYLAVDVNGGLPPVADVLRLWPARRVDSEHGDAAQGLPVRLQLQRREAHGRDSTSATRRASGPATRRWRAGAASPQGGAATIVYE